MAERDESPLELAQVRRYLERSGWSKQPTEKSSFDLYTLGPKKSAVELLLPVEGATKGPDRWVNAAIRTISQLRNSTEEDLLSEIRAFTVDVMRSRVDDALVLRDTLSMEVAITFIHSMQNLLAAAATTELNPTPHFARVMKEAKAYSEECRFGHTFRGSFGFVVESPLPTTDDATLPGIQPVSPFERRVVERIARGIASIPDAVATAQPNLIVNDFSSGLSANMCDELVSMIAVTKGSGVKFSFELSPEWASPIPSASLQGTTLGPAEAEFLADVARSMRTPRAPRRLELVGQIVALKSKGIPSDLNDLAADRQVTISALVDGIGHIEAKTHLEPADYLTALAAHREGKTVRVRGLLEQINRSWNLLEPDGVIVL